jgi:hypothetical protein
MYILIICMVQEAKSPVKNLVRQHCEEGFNSGVYGLRVEHRGRVLGSGSCLGLTGTK